MFLDKALRTFLSHPSVVARIEAAVPETFRPRVRKYGGIRYAKAAAEAASRAQNWSEAAIRWEQVLDDYEGAAQVDAYVRLAVAYQKQGNFCAAEEVIRSGRNHYPSNIQLSMEYAEIANGQKNWPMAVARLEAVLAEFGNAAPASAYLALSVAYRKQFRFEDAEEAVKRGRDLHSHNERLAVEYAEIAVAQRNWPLALRRLEAIVSAFGHRTPVKTYLQLSLANRKLGRFDEAEATLRRARQRNTRNRELAIEYAEIAMGRSDWSEAVTRWRELLQTYGKKAPGQVYKGLYIALCSLGDHRSARPILEEYLRREETVNYEQWITRHDTLTENDRALIRAHVDSFGKKPTLSVLMPVYNTPSDFLEQAIKSLLAQLYQKWELCVVDDASTLPRIRKVLESYASRDSRIRPIFRSENRGIAACTNTALEMSRGDWIVLMDHDDLLSEHALYLVAHAINENPDATIIYSDADKVDAAGRRYQPYFKPDWDPDLFLGQNCINHLGAYRADMARQIGGFRDGFDGSQDWDFALRMWDASPDANVHHVPFVLYHWRVTDNSFSRRSLDRALASAQRAVSDHLARIGTAAEVSAEGHSSHLRVRRLLPAERPLASIVIPTKNRGALLRTCLEGLFNRTEYKPIEVVLVDNGSDESDALSLLTEIQCRDNVRVVRDTQPFNFARLVNLGVAASSGEVCVLLNNDTDVINSDWLKEMVSHAIRPEVGAVGAKLYYANDTLQHGGVILGFHGVAGHVHRLYPRNSPGYWNRLNLTHGLSCVTAACLATRREVYNSVGGFDETSLPVSYNDVDFCIRVRRAGYKIIWTPNVEMYHYESISRGHFFDTAEKAQSERAAVEFMRKQWGEVLDSDPAYNPNLSLRKQFQPVDTGEKDRVTKPWIEFAVGCAKH